MNWSYILKRNAEVYPDKICLIGSEKRWTYRQLYERTNSLAQGLRDLGVRQGDIVAVLLLNCCEYIEITFAVNQIGAVWLPLNFRLAEAEFQYILENAGAVTLITEGAFVPTAVSLSEKLPGLKQMIVLGSEAPGGSHSYEDLVERNLGTRTFHAEVEEDSLHRLIYTSGTTAHPKGVMITYGNLYWKNIGHMVVFGLTAEDRTLVVGPLYHVGGMDLPGTGTLYVGGSMVILKKFDPKAVLKAIEDEKVTNLWLSPAMTIMLFNEPSFGDYDVSSVRFIIDGGEKMPATLIEEFKNRFPKAWFADAYGLTETVSGDTFLAKDRMLNKLGSVGKPVPHLHVRILDDNDQEMPPNELGEICLKGPKVFKGYWKNPDATAKALKGGWFHTGDIGTVDEHGYLYIMDRKKDMIISGGENIASPEVERIIYELPAVLEAAVVGIPHPKWLEVPKAYVVKKPGQTLTKEEIIGYCHGKMAKFKVPKEIEFIAELPRNPSGKVLKRELRAMHMKETRQN
ncbi:MAG: long-chain fatty acid--CoA ligase [Deltaproteobacteria bacterium]|nr:long-chain fatty acid--CoA ligase [Deltaproteobacteria bacterium]